MVVAAVLTMNFPRRGRCGVFVRLDRAASQCLIRFPGAGPSPGPVPAGLSRNSNNSSSGSSPFELPAIQQHGWGCPAGAPASRNFDRGSRHAMAQLAREGHYDIEVDGETRVVI